MKKTSNIEPKILNAENLNRAVKAFRRKYKRKELFIKPTHLIMHPTQSAYSYLRPCPWCGRIPEIYYVYKPPTFRITKTRGYIRFWSIECIKSRYCPHPRIIRRKKSSAIKAWNRRYDDQKIDFRCAAKINVGRLKDLFFRKLDKIPSHT